MSFWVFTIWHNLSFSLVKSWVLSQFEFCHNLSLSQLHFFLVLSQFWFFSFVTILVFEFCHHLSLSIIAIWVCEFHHNLSFWVSSKLDFLSFITFWVVEFHHNLSCWVSSQFEFLIFITIWNSSFSTIWVFDFHPNLSFWVSSQLELLSLSFRVSSEFEFLNLLVNFLFCKNKFSCKLHCNGPNLKS